jgi:hypothetical protein
MTCNVISLLGSCMTFDHISSRFFDCESIGKFINTKNIVEVIPVIVSPFKISTKLVGGSTYLVIIINLFKY